MAILSQDASLLQPTGGASQVLQPTGGNTSPVQSLQVSPYDPNVALAPAYHQTLTGSDTPQKTALLTNTTVDPAQAAAAAKAAADAAQAAQLRDQITQLANHVKDIYNGRYGQVDASAGEQAGKLNDRFGKESSQLEDQVGQQNEQAGAAFASNGAYDSSYRGNAQDMITKAGNQQIGALGDDLKSNLATIAQWAQSQKSGFDAGKGSVDTILSRLSTEKDPANLTTLRNKIDEQIATLQSQASDNNTESQNLASLEQIAPSSARAQQLKTTLQSILGGSADPSTKASIANSLIGAADIPQADQSKLLAAFHTDLADSQDQQQQQTA